MVRSQEVLFLEGGSGGGVAVGDVWCGGGQLDGEGGVFTGSAGDVDVA